MKEESISLKKLILDTGKLYNLVKKICNVDPILQTQYLTSLKGQKIKYNEIVFYCQYCKKQYHSYQAKGGHHRTCQLKLQDLSISQSSINNQHLLEQKIKNIEIKIIDKQKDNQDQSQFLNERINIKSKNQGINIKSKNEEKNKIIDKNQSNVKSTSKRQKIKYDDQDFQLKIKQPKKIKMQQKNIKQNQDSDLKRVTRGYKKIKLNQ